LLADEVAIVARPAAFQWLFFPADIARALTHDFSCGHQSGGVPKSQKAHPEPEIAILRNEQVRPFQKFAKIYWLSQFVTRFSHFWMIRSHQLTKSKVPLTLKYCPENSNPHGVGVIGWQA
jgi:hypothetical protein